MPSSSHTTRKSTTLTTDPLVEAERACAQFEATQTSGTSTQTAATMEAYRGLSSRVSQAIDQWCTQHATYKAIVDADCPSPCNEVTTDTRSIAELLTTVNELATKLDHEVEAMGNGTGSLDTAVMLWQQHQASYTVLHARLGASLREVA